MCCVLCCDGRVLEERRCQLNVDAKLIQHCPHAADDSAGVPWPCSPIAWIETQPSDQSSTRPRTAASVAATARWSQLYLHRPTTADILNNEMIVCGEN